MGRPRRERPATVFGITMEPALRAALDTRAQAVGETATSYARRLLAVAFDYQDVSESASLLQLEDRVNGELLNSVGRLDCREPMARDYKMLQIRVDEELGDRLRGWCDQIEVTYSSFVRALVRAALGIEPEDLVPDHVQLSLRDWRPMAS